MPDAKTVVLLLPTCKYSKAPTPALMQIREASSTQEEERLDAIARCMGLEAEREKSKREKDALMTAYWRATVSESALLTAI
eukprot:1160963-Pelagomonas_calceolata.AAC.10